MKYKLVEIIWEDSQCLEGWRTIEKIDFEYFGESLEKKTVGYLLKKTDKFISVAQSYEPNGEIPQCDNIFTVPRSCIKRIRVIK